MQHRIISSNFITIWCHRLNTVKIYVLNNFTNSRFLPLPKYSRMRKRTITKCYVAKPLNAFHWLVWLSDLSCSVQMQTEWWRLVTLITDSKKITVNWLFDFFNRFCFHRALNSRKMMIPKFRTSSVPGHAFVKYLAVVLQNIWTWSCPQCWQQPLLVRNFPL